MDFIDEDARPRFLLQARSPYASSPQPETVTTSKLHTACCLSAAAAFIIAAFSVQSYTSVLFTLLIWFSLSLLLAPFAPPSITGGDPHVGRGDPLPPLVPKSSELTELRRRPASRWNPKPTLPSQSPSETLYLKSEQKKEIDLSGHAGKSAKELVQRQEWTEEDFEILKRQVLKHPAGVPGRWDRVAEAFTGRHGVESVIQAAKSLSEKRPPGGDSFAQFLKKRKPLDKRVDAITEESSVNSCSGDSIDRVSVWSSGEDIALLNALKAFPKNAPMRWEKVAAAVVGKSKAECMGRVAELKRNFRSSKNSES